MSKRTAFLDRIAARPVLLGMVHLKGESAEEKLEIAQREIGLLYANGVDAVIVENYFGSPEDMERVLGWLQATRPADCYGVNVLDDDERGFAMAGRFGASFVQLDSVAGHLSAEDEPAFAERLAGWRHGTDAAVLGGVRFKYQPYLSGNDVETDLRLGMERADAIVVTGDGTGMETDLGRIREFRSVLQGFPLIVGAGVTSGNYEAQLEEADGAIVGSFLKDTGTDTGDVDGARVAELSGLVHALR